MDKLLSENHSSDETDEFPISMSRVVVLKNKEAREIFKNWEPADTRNDQSPIPALEDRASLSMFASCSLEKYVPDEGHFTKGTSFSEPTGKI